MKKVFKFALVAFAAAAVVVACQKPVEEQNPNGTETPDDQTPDDQTPDDQTPEDLEGAWSVVGKFNGWDGDVDMTKGSDGWYVAENVELTNVTNTDDGFKFRRDKGWDINLGLDGDAAVVDLDTEIALEKNGGNICLAKDGVYTLYLKPTEKLAKIHFVKDIEVQPEPEGLIDWATLNADYLVSLELPVDAEKTGIESAKAYYDDKLYIRVELSEETLADTKARLHVYFDVDDSGLLKQNSWTGSKIDYVTEGKIHENGAFVDYSSTLYATLQEGWVTTPTEYTLAYASVGAENHYELSIDFANSGLVLPVAFNIGVDVVYADWGCHGFLPVAEKLARIVKVGETDPGEEVVPAAPTPTDFAALADGAELTFEGIVASVAKNGVVVTDGTTNIYVYKPDTTPAVGDKVSVKATKTTYYNLIEASEGATVTVLSSGNEVPYTTPVDITDTFDAYPDAEHTSDLLSVTGELVVSDHVNLNVAGATARQGSLQGVDITALAGKNIKLLGYYIGTSGSGGKYLVISVVSAEEVAAAPVSITLDGDLGDWAGIDAVAVSGIPIKEYKSASDADNLYLYFKIARSGIKASDDGTYKWKRYIYFGFDTDNDSSTGTVPTKGGLKIEGCEVLALVYPFRGDTTNGLLIVNGLDEESWFATPDASSKNGSQMTVYGTTDDDYAYLEIGLPREGLGSPAAGTIKAQFSFSWDLTEVVELTLN